jgi:hypothetical protein
MEAVVPGGLFKSGEIEVFAQAVVEVLVPRPAQALEPIAGRRLGRIARART